MRSKASEEKRKLFFALSAKRHKAKRIEDAQYTQVEPGVYIK